MKVIYDLDGCVWNIMEIFVEIYNEKFNENVKYEDIDDWWFFDYDKWKVVYPLTLPRIMEYPPMDKMIDFYISEICKNNDVSILTAEANPVEVLEEKLKTLNILKGEHYKEIIRIDPNRNKLDYEADVYVDDNPNMAEKMNQYPDRTLLLYDQPWNQNFDDSDTENVWRVFGWDEVVLAIDIILKNKKGRLL